MLVRRCLLTVVLVLRPCVAQEGHDVNILCRVGPAETSGLRSSCNATGLQVGGQVCFHDVEGWRVDLRTCKTSTCLSMEGESRCAGMLSTEDMGRALKMALQDVGVAMYSRQHVLGGSAKRLGGYLTQFLIAFLSSLLEHATTSELLGDADMASEKRSTERVGHQDFYDVCTQHCASTF